MFELHVRVTSTNSGGVLLKEMSLESIQTDTSRWMMSVKLL
jgi:hypothetical protein